jgi:hypothetical protein
MQQQTFRMDDLTRGANDPGFDALLAVTNAPTVAAAGTYLVTPEFTAGDAAMFSQLVNGLISMAR